jgi:hypothetical protein
MKAYKMGFNSSQFAYTGGCPFPVKSESELQWFKGRVDALQKCGIDINNKTELGERIYSAIN